MNKKNWPITSRIELLLAKIAGRDVDLNTMTPPVASNTTEEMLLEIAERMDKGGNAQNYALPEITDDNVDSFVAASKSVTVLNTIIPYQKIDILDGKGKCENVNSLYITDGALVRFKLVGSLYSRTGETTNANGQYQSRSSPITVSVDLSTLEPGIAYHVTGRVTADSFSGQTNSSTTCAVDANIVYKDGVSVPFTSTGDKKVSKIAVYADSIKVHVLTSGDESASVNLLFERLDTTTVNNSYDERIFVDPDGTAIVGPFTFADDVMMIDFHQSSFIAQEFIVRMDLINTEYHYELVPDKYKNSIPTVYRLGDDADLSNVIAAVNNLIDGLGTSGLMHTD